MEKVYFRYLGATITFILTVVLTALLFAVLTMFAWNNSVHELFNLPVIDFWQGFWLNMLSGMLVKSTLTTKADSV